MSTVIEHIHSLTHITKNTYINLDRLIHCVNIIARNFIVRRAITPISIRYIKSYINSVIAKIDANSRMLHTLFDLESIIAENDFALGPPDFASKTLDDAVILALISLYITADSSSDARNLTGNEIHLVKHFIIDSIAISDLKSLGHSAADITAAFYFDNNSDIVAASQVYNCITSVESIKKNFESFSLDIGVLEGVSTSDIDGRYVSEAKNLVRAIRRSVTQSGNYINNQFADHELVETVSNTREVTACVKYPPSYSNSISASLRKEISLVTKVLSINIVITAFIKSYVDTILTKIEGNERLSHIAAELVSVLDAILEEQALEEDTTGFHRALIVLLVTYITIGNATGSEYQNEAEIYRLRQIIIDALIISKEDVFELTFRDIAVLLYFDNHSDSISAAGVYRCISRNLVIKERIRSYALADGILTGLRLDDIDSEYVIDLASIVLEVADEVEVSV